MSWAEINRFNQKVRWKFHQSIVLNSDELAKVTFLSNCDPAVVIATNMLGAEKWDQQSDLKLEIQT